MKAQLVSNLRKAFLLALTVLLLATATNTASAQNQPGQFTPTFDRLQLQVGQDGGMQRPDRPLPPSRDWKVDDVIPFGDKPPILDFAWFAGQVGNDIPGGRKVAVQPISEFTADKAGDEPEKWKTVKFTIFTLTTPIDNSKELAHTDIGRTSRDSTMRYMISRDGYVAVDFDLAGTSVYTSKEMHPSGGAFEGRFVAYRNKFGGWCVLKHVSSPEGFDISSFGKRISYGSFTGGDHLWFCDHCAWKVGTYEDRFNHIAINQLPVLTGDEVGWYAIRFSQPGTVVDFAFGVLNLKMPTP